jgi:AbiU2
MNPAQQIEKLKGHVLLFSEGVRSLVQTFAMLRPVAEDAELLKRYSGTDRARGLTVIRWSMIQECLIEITKLAYDDGQKNPSARNLGSCLLGSEKIKEALKAKFVVPIRPARALVGEQGIEEDLAFEREFEKEIEALETKELETCFEDYLKEINRGLAWFEERRDKFKTIRDKQLAHLETSKIGPDYVITPVTGPDWKTVKDAVCHLVELAEFLLTVVHRKDESFPQFRDLAKRDADLFWE